MPVRSLPYARLAPAARASITARRAGPVRRRGGDDGSVSLIAVAAAGLFVMVLATMLLPVLLLGGGGGIAAADAVLKPGSVPAQYLPWVTRAGQLCPQVSAPLLAAQLAAETPWDPRAVSPVGAQGLGQFMPGTWPSYGRDDDGNGTASPFDPGDAIMAMGRYDCALAIQVAKVPGDATSNMLAAYNAGPGAVLKHQGIPPYPETQGYVQKILAALKGFTDPSAPQAGDPIFPAGTGFGQRVVAFARKWLGTPYVWGGGNYKGPSPRACGHGICADNAFDCSGLVQYAVYQASGRKLMLPRTAKTQGHDERGQRIRADLAEMLPGDIIAFSNHDWGHIGIYIGDGKMIHAPKTGDVVKISPLAGYYETQTWLVRRFG